MDTQDDAVLWDNFMSDRLDTIGQRFNDSRYHELMTEQQGKRILTFTGTLNEEQQAKFADIDEANSLIRETEELTAYRTGMLDGIRLMCSL